MITQPLTTVDESKHYILLTSSDKLEDQNVTNWSGVLKQLRAAYTLLDNFRVIEDKVQAVPVILEVVEYTPPPAFTPQDTRRKVLPKERKQPTGWFHHKSPGTDPVVKANGITLEWDEGCIPEKVVDPIYAPVCCIHCSEELQSTIGSIRAMVLKGWIETQVDGDIDPTTGNPVVRVRRIPNYKTGRLCKPCQVTLIHTVGDNPPKRGEFQYLHERIKLRKRVTVTAGMAKSLDLQLEKEAAAERCIDKGDVIIPEPKIKKCRICAHAVRGKKCEHCGGSPELIPVSQLEDIDVTAYRALHKMGRTKRYDPDLNSTNATIKGGNR